MTYQYLPKYHGTDDGLVSSYYGQGSGRIIISFLGFGFILYLFLIVFPLLGSKLDSFSQLISGFFHLINI